jgi:hypothetical protein
MNSPTPTVASATFTFVVDDTNPAALEDLQLQLNRPEQIDPQTRKKLTE